MFDKQPPVGGPQLFTGKSRGANWVAQHSSGLLDAIYMPDCESGRWTPIAGEDTSSATIRAAARRMADCFSTNDRLSMERKGQQQGGQKTLLRPRFATRPVARSGAFRLGVVVIVGGALSHRVLAVWACSTSPKGCLLFFERCLVR